MKTITSRSAEETRKIASSFAKSLSGGAIIALFGPLGAGKTEFTKGLAQALGIKRSIKSPTFVLEKLYPFTRKNKRYLLRHLDLYRITSQKELLSLEINKIPSPNIITVVEWPERINHGFTPKHSISFRLGKKSHERILNFKSAN